MKYKDSLVARWENAGGGWILEVHTTSYDEGLGGMRICIAPRTNTPLYQDIVLHNVSSDQVIKFGKILIQEAARFDKTNLKKDIVKANQNHINLKFVTRDGQPGIIKALSSQGDECVITEIGQDARCQVFNINDLTFI